MAKSIHHLFEATPASANNEVCVCLNECVEIDWFSQPFHLYKNRAPSAPLNTLNRKVFHQFAELLKDLFSYSFILMAIVSTYFLFTSSVVLLLGKKR